MYQDTSILSGFILTASLGVDLAADHHEFSAISSGYLEEISKVDETNLEKIIDMKNFARLGFAGVYEQPTVDLMGRLANELAESDRFNEGDFDFTSYFRYASIISDKVATLFELQSQASLRQKFLAEFFIAGLYNFTPSDPELQKYNSKFQEQLSASSRASALNRVGQMYASMLSPSEQQINSITELLEQIKPYSGKISFVTHDDYDDSAGQFGKDYSAWLNNHREAAKKILSNKGMDKIEVFTRLREHFYYHPLLQLGQIKNMGMRSELDAKGEVAGLIVSYFLGEMAIDNLHEHMIAYRAIFPFRVPELIEKDFEYIISSEAFKSKSVNFQKTLKTLSEATTSEEIVREKYPFVK